jgi:His-Xaa-Ser system radical SAM maturase HxsB
MDNTFRLLPFQFRKFPDGRVLLSSPSGDFVFCTAEDFEAVRKAEMRPNSDLYSILKSKGFVADKNLDLAIELNAIQLRSRKAFLNDFTALHMMVLTARCNFCCDYCHASSADSSQSELDMGIDTAERCVDLIFESPSPDIKIEFQGGEPLLNWDVLTHTVLYAERLSEKKRKRLDFVVCTNLTLLTKEKISFLRDHSVMISTSLDGPESIQNAHRKPRDREINGYAAWEMALDLLLQEWKEYTPSALLTVSSANLGSLREVIDLYMSLGFDSIFFRSLNPYGYARKNLEQLGYSVNDFVDAYKDALSYLIKRNLEGCYFPDYFTSLLLQRILTPFSTGFVDLQSPSGAVISGSLYDYTGDVFPSDEARMLARMGDKYFLMGNVHKNTYKEIWGSSIARKIVNSSCLEVLPECAWCVYQPYCGVDPVRSYLETGDMISNPIKSWNCSMYKRVFDHLFDLIYANEPDVMDVFWSWINQKPITMASGAQNAWN